MGRLLPGLSKEVVIWKALHGVLRRSSSTTAPLSRVFNGRCRRGPSRGSWKRAWGPSGAPGNLRGAGRTDAGVHARGQFLFLTATLSRQAGFRERSYVCCPRIWWWSAARKSRCPSLRSLSIDLAVKRRRNFYATTTLLFPGSPRVPPWSQDVFGYAGLPLYPGFLDNGTLWF